MIRVAGGARNSGGAEPQREMPVFPQSALVYDDLAAADEIEVFAGFPRYRSRDARPVVGWAGLRPDSSDTSLGLWGAAML